jgi:hypothetical protein
MKVSVSLPEDDVAYVDDYARRAGIVSRSAVLHWAIALLRQSELEDEYAAAAEEWQNGSDRELWDAATADGIVDAPR